MRSKIAFFLTFILCAKFAAGQEIAFKMPNHKVNVSLTELIRELEKGEGIKFFYMPEWTDNILIKSSFMGQPIGLALEKILKGRNIKFDFIYDYGVVLIKDVTKDKTRQNILSQIEDQVPTRVFGDFSNARWGEEVTFSGKIINENFKEPLEGVTIYANEIQKGVISDQSGYFSLKLPVGEHLVTIKSQNYSDKHIMLEMYSDGRLNVTLEERPMMLDEITVTDNAFSENFNNTTSGIVRLTAKEIKKIPTMLGEIDIVKSIQILPGVNTVGEGSAGFNVRGGSADQNLILLDNGIIFNPNHLFGFFTAFHPDAIDGVTFYRGAIPVEYGGRISSVLDVKQKDGDQTRIKGTGGFGLITSRLMLEGPIIKDKLSFLIAGRTSYSDWILKSINDENVRQSSADFYDFTGKVSGFLNEKSKITASLYGSKDKFKFAGDTVYFWQNLSLAINFERNIKDGLSHYTSLSAGRYSYEVRDENSRDAFSWDYGINNFQLKSFFNWSKQKHLFTMGVDLTGFSFERGKLEPLSESSSIEKVELDNDFSLVAGFFVSDEIKFGKLSVVPGFRFSSFNSFGPGSTYKYNPFFPRDDASIIDTVKFQSGKVAQAYEGFEPRVAAKYDFNSNNFVKLSISRNYQYIHLISNTTAITPIDSWVPSSRYIKPQIGYQYSLGLFKKMSNINLSTSFELFYKTIDNVPEYKNGAEVALKQNLETELVESHADIRGAEVSISKEGRLSGSVNYTYSSSRRRTGTSFNSLEINNNQFFPSNYDQPHNVKLNANYDISKRIVFSVNFNLASGRPISAPTERFEIDGIEIENYPERNQFRIPSYHRMDASLLIRTNHKKNKKWEGNWTLSVYNVYARKNAYTVFFDQSEVRRNETPKAFKLSILGTALPSITYNFIIK